MDESRQPTQDCPESRQDNRRSFFAILAGAAALLTPLAAGIASFLSPLSRKGSSSLVRVALLCQVPDDGLPHLFPVIADREDAWNRYPRQRIGAVYLVRQPGEIEPVAFTAKCPHAGCFIGYTSGDDHFQCPCHTSAFNFDGTRRNGDQEVSPRGMDQLKVELSEITSNEGEEATEVYVEFIDYQTGHKKKIPTT